MPQTVIITGASRGIGLATAEALLDDGSHVVAVQRTTTPELAVLQIRFSESLRIVQGDVTDDEVIQRALNEAEEVFGGLDSLVLNAGVNLPMGTVDKMPLAGWESIFAVNVFSVINFVRAAIPVLRKSTTGSARVTMLSSKAAVSGIPGVGVYCASKAALNSVNRTLSVEEPTILSVAVDPGSVQTDMMDRLVRKGKAFMSEDAIEALRGTTIVPEVSGRAIATLALRASKDLSGRYIQWNDPAIAGL